MHFIRLLAVLVLILGASPIFAEPELYNHNQEAVLYLTKTLPKDDGTYSGWNHLQGTSPQIFVFGAPRGPNDPSGVFVLQSDNKYLYILADITDSTANENPLPAPIAWHNDSVEVYISTDTSSHQTLSMQDMHIRLVPRSRSNPHAVGISINDITVDKRPNLGGTCIYTSKGYRIEVRIPLRMLNMQNLQVGQAFRAEFQINDASDGERENLLHWSSKNDNPYYDASVWGNGVMVAAPEDSHD